MKGQPSEERKRILGIAGNPKNAVVEKLNSVPNGFRILQRTYFYDKAKKRSRNTKKAIGVVIDNQYLTIEQYHSKYTHRGNLRTKTTIIKNNINMPDKEEASIENGSIQQKLIGAIPILYRTAENCNIIDDLYEVYGKEIADEILSISFHWILERDNAARRYKRFSTIFALPFSGQITESELAKIYSMLGTNKDLLFKLFSLRCKRLANHSCVNYDSTSIPTKASDIYYKKISKTKEGQYAPMFHLSILAEQKTGIPLLYSLFNGNEPDCSTIQDLIYKISDLKPNKNDIIFIFDRGYETLYNLLLCSKNGYKCIMATRILDQNLINNARKNCPSFTSSVTIIEGTCIHGYTEAVTTIFRGIQYKLWVHIYKDDNQAARETASFMSKLDAFEREWNQSNIEHRNNLLSSPMINFYKDSDINLQLTRLHEVIDKHIKDFGYFSNVSTFETTAKEAYEKYSGRDTIEKCFESGKMNINIDTVRSNFHDTMEGRFVVAFIALIILQELKFQLSRERTFDDKRRKVIKAHTYTVTDVLDITRGITINFSQKSNNYWMGGLLKEVKQLCVACGVDQNLYSSVPSYINLSNF